MSEKRTARATFAFVLVVAMVGAYWALICTAVSISGADGRLGMPEGKYPIRHLVFAAVGCMAIAVAAVWWQAAQHRVNRWYAGGLLLGTALASGGYPYMWYVSDQDSLIWAYPLFVGVPLIIGCLVGYVISWVLRWRQQRYDLPPTAVL